MHKSATTIWLCKFSITLNFFFIKKAIGLRKVNLRSCILDQFKEIIYLWHSRWNTQFTTFFWFHIYLPALVEQKALFQMPLRRVLSFLMNALGGVSANALLSTLMKGEYTVFFNLVIWTMAVEVRFWHFPYFSFLHYSGSNQRMEFLGDSVLQFVVSVYLFRHFPEHHEGHLTVGIHKLLYTSSS